MFSLKKETCLRANIEPIRLNFINDMKQNAFRSSSYVLIVNQPILRRKRMRHRAGGHDRCILIKKTKITESIIARDRPGQGVVCTFT